jgi:pimeloyl-ACP methyl ester carboxylesterase
MNKETLLHYFSHGEDTSRPPVIFIHGAGGSHLSWPPQMRRMKDQRVYALDLNGHGGSKGDGRKTIDEHAQDILQFMDSLDISRAALAGHSMGGAIALTIALQNPERVDALVLVGAGARLRVTPALLRTTSSAETFPQAVDIVIENSFSHYADARVKELTRQRMLTMSQPALYADFLACDSFDMLSALGAIEARTLILCGSEDKMTPPKYSQSMRDLMPDARFELIADAGHMLMLEKPVEVERLVSGFICDM